VVNYGTARIGNEFFLENVMQSGKTNLVYTHFDRYIAGGAVPKLIPLLGKAGENLD